MATLEQGIRPRQIGLNKLNLSRIGEPSVENLQSPPLITPDFFVAKLAKLKNISNVIGMEELKDRRLLVAEKKISTPKTETTPATHDLIEEISHPHKDLLDKLVMVNKVMQRFRRGSRCLAQEDHPPRKCRGRVHLKGTGSVQGLINQPVSINARKAENQNKTASKLDSGELSKQKSQNKPLAA